MNAPTGSGEVWRSTLADVPPPDELACRRLLSLLKAGPSTESELAGDRDDAA